MRTGATALVCAAVVAAAGALGGSAGAVAASPAAASPGLGKALFVGMCGSCHTLRAARTHGRTGPNLDDEGSSYGDVVDQVVHGGGGMPAFSRSLRAAQIRAVAAFVVASTRASSGGGDD